MNIDPPLLNSANPWATTYEDLIALYKCPYTGAVTTRTSMLEGFPHDNAIHKYAFFNPKTHKTDHNIECSTSPSDHTASVNNLGYSPLPLREYLDIITRISEDVESDSALRRDKPIIVSVTGTGPDVAKCLDQINKHNKGVLMPLAMEINLSCPNIPDKPPPAYSTSSLAPYVQLVGMIKNTTGDCVPIGLKLPPYTYADQFQTLINVLDSHSPCPISFLTSTNTLGSSLLLQTSSDAGSTHAPILASSTEAQRHGGPQTSGLGGLAGSALHPLALGNVYSLNELLRQNEKLSNIQIIGVGGVEDKEGYNRMRSVGASAVGVGTGLGRLGTGVFAKIAKGEET